MKKILLLLVITICVGCAKPQPPSVTVPRAYLHLEPAPAIPREDATNLDFIQYVFSLSDQYKQCRQNITLIRQWQQRSENKHE